MDEMQAAEIRLESMKANCGYAISELDIFAAWVMSATMPTKLPANTTEASDV